MRRFKFFFALSLGIGLFFFLAKFLIMGLIGAVILSAAFFVGSKVFQLVRRFEGESHYQDSFLDDFPRRDKMSFFKERFHERFQQNGSQESFIHHRNIDVL